MGVIEGVAAVTAVDNAGGEVAFAVRGVAGTFGLVAWEIDREPEVVDAILIVSGETIWLVAI